MPSAIRMQSVWTARPCLGQLLLNVVFLLCNTSHLSVIYAWLVLISWWSGVVVSTLALINEVNLRRTRLVLRWVTVSGSIPAAGHLFQYVTNQPPKANSAFHPSRVGKWVPASAGKAKAGMVHSVSGRTRGVQVKLWYPLRTRAIPEPLRGVFTTRRYTSPRLPLHLCLGFYRTQMQHHSMVMRSIASFSLLRSWPQEEKVWNLISPHPSVTDMVQSL